MSWLMLQWGRPAQQGAKDRATSLVGTSPCIAKETTATGMGKGMLWPEEEHKFTNMEKAEAGCRPSKLGPCNTGTSIMAAHQVHPVLFYLFKW